MIGDVGLFAFSLFDTGGLLFLTVYVVITLSDLECDYLNAQECCTKLNKWVTTEMVAQAALNIMLLLVNGHWILFLVNAPLTAWLLYRVLKVPGGNFGVYDPTEIHNRGSLKVHMRDSVIRLAYYLTMFFIYLYCMILSLLTRTSPRTVGAAGEF
ncbi:protein cornichon homolog 4 [Galendromus occidentalis]|uniref:Protein cornichon homolog 4 n=1 Tax=Galendromus occidentalis TaxID=34638 RepID=A0AAJ6VVL8_9ACAR|nr:protein cornichon homolog 4 [Galendromus occidentalis]